MLTNENQQQDIHARQASWLNSSAVVNWLIGFAALLLIFACSLLALVTGVTTHLISRTTSGSNSFSFVATETPFPNPHLNPGEIIHHYQFDGGETWPTFNDNSDWLTIERFIEGGKYRWVAKAKDSGFTYDASPEFSIPIDDDLYQVSVDAHVIDGPPDASVGLIFARRENDYWIWEVLENGNGMLIEKKTGNWMDPAALASSMPVNRGGTNTLTVRIHNCTVKYYVNGWHAGTYTLPVDGTGKNFQSDTIGVSVGLRNPGDAATVEFDNIIISRPESIDFQPVITPSSDLVVSK